MRKALVSRDTDTIKKSGLKNGDMLHINNKDAQIVNLPPPPKQIKRIEDKKEEAEDTKMEEEIKPKLDPHGRVLKSVEEKKDDGKIRDSYGREIKAAPKEEPKKDVKMINDKVLGDDTGDQFVKH
jgi:hypothetical protein